MTKHNFFKRTVCIAAAAAALFTSAAIPFPAAAAEDDVTETQESTLPTHLMNGDFEAPTVETFVSSTGSNHNEYWNGHRIDTSHWNNLSDPDDIIFRDNDAWLVTSKDNFDLASNNQFYWDTTATDKRIELGTTNIPDNNLNTYWNGPDANKNTGNRPTTLSTIMGAGSGKQFAELVAEEQASLYQNIQTEPGSTLTWSLMHRARYDNSTKGKDTMALFIGPMQEGDLKKTDPNDDDLFMTMADYIYKEGYADLGQGIAGPHTLYSKKYTNSSQLDDQDFLSDTQDNEHTQQWTFWVITGDYMSWETYADNYTVPAGQEATTFAFASLTAAKVSSITDNYNQGNCLDNIDFGVLYPLTVNALEGGSGTVTATEPESQPIPADVQSGTTFSGLYEDGTTVSFSAEAQEGYTFIGATIDGLYYDVNEFTRNGNVYTYNTGITMDTAHEITLMFAENGKVSYDPNGGTFNGTDDLTSHVFSYYNNSRSETETPTKEGSTFLGWRVYTTNGEEAQAELVPAAHNITYHPGYDLHNPTLTINHTGSNSLDLDASNDDAVLLVAQWSYKAEAVACTMSFGETGYTCGNEMGGNVSISAIGTESADNYIMCDTGDEFTLTATPTAGYSFEGWYVESDGTEHLLSENTTYTETFSYSGSVTFHAHFSEDPITPYLSVVAQNEQAEQTLKNKGLTAHGAVVNTENSETVYNNSTYGNEKYGNTISTGFFTTRTIGENNSSVNLRGVWTIYLSSENAYMKTQSSNDSNISGEAVVTDTEDTEVFNGAIYPAGSALDRIVKFSVDGPTVTGGTVVFGIVIDNLYAPNARAGFRVNGTDDDALNQNNSVIATPNDEYDQSKLDAIGSTSSTDTQTID